MQNLIWSFLDGCQECFEALESSRLMHHLAWHRLDIAMFCIVIFAFFVVISGE